MGFLFIFSILIFYAILITAYLISIRKKQEEIEYIWVGKGEDPCKDMKD